MMARWSVVGRLQQAVNKVRFLLKFNLQKWLSSAALLDRSISGNRHLSFGQFSPDTSGLSVAVAGSGLSRGSSSSLRRTISRCLSSDLEFDIDRRAEMFIANFHRQLQMERQISLELQYQKKENQI